MASRREGAEGAGKGRGKEKGQFAVVVGWGDGSAWLIATSSFFGCHQEERLVSSWSVSHHVCCLLQAKALLFFLWSLCMCIECDVKKGWYI